MNFQEYLYLLWVLVVGAIGGVLGLLDDDGKPRKHRTKRAFAVATITAMFLCWTTFAISKLLIHEVEGALADLPVDHAQALGTPLVEDELAKRRAAKRQQAI